MITSGRNKLILKPYDGKIVPEAEVKSGFATVKQRSRIVGLQLVVDAIVEIGGKASKIPAGSSIYFAEEVLATNQWAKKRLTCPDLYDGEFVVADYSQVMAVRDNESNN